MTDTELDKIRKQLIDHETRLNVLESSDNGPTKKKQSLGVSKQKTLREIINGKSFKSGQEKLTVIVGYHEKELGSPIKNIDLENAWIDAKMAGKFDRNYLKRALNDHIRVLEGGVCDLTRTGEDLYEKLISND